MSNLRQFILLLSSSLLLLLLFLIIIILLLFPPLIPLFSLYFYLLQDHSCQVLTQSRRRSPPHSSIYTFASSFLKTGPDGTYPKGWKMQYKCRSLWISTALALVRLWNSLVACDRAKSLMFTRAAPLGPKAKHPKNPLKTRSSETWKQLGLSLE